MDKYVNPFESRYSSKEMLFIYSPKNKYELWRKLWYHLANEQKRLGLKITNEQLLELKNNIDNINFNEVGEFERKFKHEVMAHLYAYAKQAPLAKGILHLGATSAFLMDNGDLIQIKQALFLIKERLLTLFSTLSNFCFKYREFATIAYTHFQKAQLTTLGKRASLWLLSLFYDFENIERLLKELPFRGLRGTVGTEASIKELFNGDISKVKSLNSSLAKIFGFKKMTPLSLQTYDRKIDTFVLNALSAIAESAHKMTNDIRLMQGHKEIEENFTINQIGSSAMPYKRNPIYSERVSSLSKYLISLPLSASLISSTQWLERSLDDSACRRITIPQAFLTADAILILLNNIVKNLKVNEKIIELRVKDNMPFVLSEYILMKSSQNGGDRQFLHEKIREHSMFVINKFYEGEKLDLIEILAKDEDLKFSSEELMNLSNPQLHIGFAKEQVEDFLKEYINPILKKKSKIESEVEINV